MAAADYRLCDKCAGKAFYDANLNYEQGGDIEGSLRNAGTLMSNTSLGRLGDWTVLCKDCANWIGIEPSRVRKLRADPKLPDVACTDGTLIPGWIVANMQGISAWFKANGSENWHVGGIGPIRAPAAGGVTVNDAMVERALDAYYCHGATWRDVAQLSSEAGLKREMRAALTAALRPDAVEKDK